MTGRHRSAVFGGWYDGGSYHNDTYVLDMETWVRIYIIAMITCDPHTCIFYACKQAWDYVEWNVGHVGNACTEVE